MPDQTQASLANSQKNMASIAISNADKRVLNALASKVKEFAARPIEDEKRQLWYRHNALEETRPLIFCDPENGWNEIITDAELKCTGELARSWEMHLRKEIFWAESMRDDRVTEQYFNVPNVYTDSGWGLEEIKRGGEDGGSYVWEAPLKRYDEDFGKLSFPEIAVDHEATERLKSLAHDTVGEHLEIRVRNPWWWTLGMTWTLVKLRGIEQIMFDCYDHPDELKRLMAFLRDGTLARLDYLEANGLLNLNNDGTYVGSGGFGWSDELPAKDFDRSRVRTRDMWGFCESQETATWSPEMFAEFIFPYQLPILERFGLNCYGCCEALDKRWHIVKDIPNLRRVSVSAWADTRNMAEKLDGDYIYSMKPIPTDISTPAIDHDRIRADLRENIRLCRGNHLEIIMKDNHTIGNNPQNVIDWCRIAREEAGA